jgi:hypothetical protein
MMLTSRVKPHSLATVPALNGSFIQHRRVSTYPDNRVSYFLEKLPDTLTSDQLPSVDRSRNRLKVLYTRFRCCFILSI